MNIIRVLPCRFQSCLGTFTILLVQASSETGLFRHLSHYVFGVRNFEKTKFMRVIFFSKCSNCNINFNNEGKNSEKVFCSWFNCIWIGILKLSPLRTGYISSVANGLTSSPKISHVNKKLFFEDNFLASNQRTWSRCCDADFNSAWARLAYSLCKHHLKRDFLNIYLTTFSESVTSKIQNLWGSFFHSKCSKFNLNFKNPAKDSEKFFCCWDNCIWIGIVKLSLLRTEHFSSVANVLTSSPKVLHVNKRDFFQFCFLGTDPWVWSRSCDADFNSAWARLPCCL